MFLTKNSGKLIHIPNYKLYANNRKEHKGGGTAILVWEGMTHNRCKDLETMIEKEAESTYIKMTSKNSKHIIIGRIYRSPNTCEKKLKVHIADVNFKIRSKNGKKELVLVRG